MKFRAVSVGFLLAVCSLLLVCVVGHGDAGEHLPHTPNVKHLADSAGSPSQDSTSSPPTSEDSDTGLGVAVAQSDAATSDDAEANLSERGRALLGSFDLWDTLDRALPGAYYNRRALLGYGFGLYLTPRLTLFYAALFDGDALEDHFEASKQAAGTWVGPWLSFWVLWLVCPAALTFLLGLLLTSSNPVVGAAVMLSSIVAGVCEVILLLDLVHGKMLKRNQAIFSTLMQPALQGCYLLGYLALGFWITPWFVCNLVAYLSFLAMVVDSVHGLYQHLRKLRRDTPSKEAVGSPSKPAKLIE